LSGRLTSDLALDGSPSDPLVAGEARIVDGMYENMITGTFVQDLGLDANGNLERLAVTRLEASDGRGGRISGNGEMSLDLTEAFPFDFRARFDNATLINLPNAEARVRGEIEVAGSLDGASATGEIIVTEANVTFEPGPSRDIPELEVEYANQLEEPESTSTLSRPSTLPDVKLDIGIRLPGQAFFVAQDVRTEWAGDIRVSGTLEKPQFLGRIRPVRGYIAFVGRRFTLQPESVIVLDTKTSTSPYIDLIATTRRDDISATLTIRGTLDEIDINLSSDPPLPQEEVLSRVLFGRDASEISPVQAFQLARAAAILSGRVRGIPFFSGPSRLAFVDTFDIRSEEEGTVLSVGKYVTSDIYVVVEQGTATGSDLAKIEFELTPSISLETWISGETGGGVGILWQYDY
jgi:autotransporter translocation and assembly factor TamB